MKFILTELRPFELSLFIDFMDYRILSLCNHLLLQFSLLIVFVTNNALGMCNVL